MPSNVDGYFEVSEDRSKRPVKRIEVLNSDIMKFAQGKGKLGRGSMGTKLQAAKIVAETGIEVVIANGTKYGIIKGILSGKNFGTKIGSEIFYTNQFMKTSLKYQVFQQHTQALALVILPFSACHPLDSNHEVRNTHLTFDYTYSNPVFGLSIFRFLQAQERLS